MEMQEAVSVADAKSHFSEYLVISHTEGKRIIITKRGKPFAAIVGLEDLNNLRHLDEREGLAQIIGKWQSFEEIAPSIEEAFKNRYRDEHRHVSL